jgi:hypothetical protein
MNATKKLKIKTNNNKNNNKNKHNSYKHNKTKDKSKNKTKTKQSINIMQFIVFDSAPISANYLTHGTMYSTIKQQAIVLNPQNMNEMMTLNYKQLEDKVYMIIQLHLLQDAENVITVQHNTKQLTKYYKLTINNHILKLKCPLVEFISLNFQQNKPTITNIIIKYAMYTRLPCEGDEAKRTTSVSELSCHSSLTKTQNLNDENIDSSGNEQEEEEEEDEEIEDSEINTQLPKWLLGCRPQRPDQLKIGKAYYTVPNQMNKTLIYLPSYQAVYPIMFADKVYNVPEQPCTQFKPDEQLTIEQQEKYPTEHLQVMKL